MLKKTVLSLAVVGAIAAGAAMTSSQASAASVRVGLFGPGFSVSVGSGFHGRHWRRFGHHHCTRRFVRFWSPRFGWIWKTKYRCHWHRYW